MYEQQKPFRLNELVRISAFLNNLVFKMLWNEMVDGTYVTTRRLIFRLLSSNPKKARALRKFSENCMLSWLSDTRIRQKRKIDILAYILLPIVNICSFSKLFSSWEDPFPLLLIASQTNIFSLSLLYLYGSFSETKEQMLNSAHTLLMILYDRDCRRTFTTQDHWLVRWKIVFKKKINK